MSPPAHIPHIPSRADGAQARQRLLDAALRLFAAHGYKKTSTREIAEAAGVNLGAIAYYFGDKANLYKTAVDSACCNTDGGVIQPADCTPCLDLTQPLEAVLHQMFVMFMTPLKQGERIQLMMRIHYREMVEPSGALLENPYADMIPFYAGLQQLICLHLERAAPDADTTRLTQAILGMGTHFYASQDMIEALSPGFFTDPEGIDTLAARLGCWATGMIRAEQQRRAPPENTP